MEDVYASLKEGILEHLSLSLEKLQRFFWFVQLRHTVVFVLYLEEKESNYLCHQSVTQLVRRGANGEAVPEELANPFSADFPASLDQLFSVLCCCLPGEEWVHRHRSEIIAVKVIQTHKPDSCPSFGQKSLFTPMQTRICVHTFTYMYVLIYTKLYSHESVSFPSIYLFLHLFWKNYFHLTIILHYCSVV